MNNSLSKLEKISWTISKYLYIAGKNSSWRSRTYQMIDPQLYLTLLSVSSTRSYPSGYIPIYNSFVITFLHLISCLTWSMLIIFCCVSIVGKNYIVIMIHDSCIHKKFYLVSWHNTKPYLLKWHMLKKQIM